MGNRPHDARTRAGKTQPHTAEGRCRRGDRRRRLYMLHRLRGMGLRVLVLKAGSGVGGTWYWNRYPGARCDVERVQSYQFNGALQQE